MAGLRKARGLTQAQLAQRIDISRRMVAYYEGQSDRPPAHVLDRLAAVLGVSADQLLGRRQTAGDVQIPFDVRIWRRLRIVEKLPPADRNAVIKYAEALARNSNLKIDPDDRRKAS
jgi:transcriptional regulator with XRE-family HTH domain